MNGLDEIALEAWSKARGLSTDAARNIFESADGDDDAERIYQSMRKSFADGKCHNSEPGWFNQECGKPAMWIGTSRSGFKVGYCLRCRAEGFEARGVVKWEPVKESV